MIRPTAISQWSYVQRYTRSAISRAEGVGRLKLGRQDSNLRSRDQNPLPYHLATPHLSRPSLEPCRQRERSPRSSMIMISATTAPTITIANTVTVMKSGMIATTPCENARIQAALRIAGDLSRLR
jgi:hypothetical protein